MGSSPARSYLLHPLFQKQSLSFSSSKTWQKSRWGCPLNRSLVIKALPQVVGNLSQLLPLPEGTQTHLPESFLNSVSICSLHCRYWPCCGMKENWKWTRLETKNKTVLPRSTVTSLSKGHFNQDAFAVHKVRIRVQNFLLLVKRKARTFPSKWNDSTEEKRKIAYTSEAEGLSKQLLNVHLNSPAHGGGRQVSSMLAEWSDNWTKNNMVAVSREKTVAAAVCYVVPCRLLMDQSSEEQGTEEWQIFGFWLGRWEIFSAVEAGVLCGMWKSRASGILKTESSYLEAPVQ